jgi:hypothetical protein
MADNQLILGEVEQLDGAGNPVPQQSQEQAVLQDAEKELYAQSIAIPDGSQEEAPFVRPRFDVQESDEYLNPVDMAPLDPLALGEEEKLEPSPGQAEHAADIYNMAALGSGMPPITAEAVFQALTSDTPVERIQTLLTGIRQEDLEVRKEAAVMSLLDPLRGVEDRLEVVQQLEAEGPDLNMVSRQALHNANWATSMYEDTDEGDEDAAAATEYIEDLPRNIEAIVESDISEEDMRAGYEALLNAAFSQANEGAGWSNFAATLVPFRFQAPVMKIYDSLGLNREAVSAVGGNVLMGEALRQIREHVNGLGTEQKVEALGTILRILKPSGGVFRDGNDWVTAHVLSEVYQTELFGPIETEMKPGEFRPVAVKRTGGDPLRATEVLDNAGSILDLIGVGAVAKGTIKMGTRFLPKSMRRLSNVSPEMVSKNLVDALSDPALRARLSEMTGPDIVENFLPASSMALREGGVNGLQEMITRQLDIREGLLRVAERTNYTAAERADALKEVDKIFGDFAAKPASTLHLDKSVIASAGNGVEISAVFGRTKDKGYATLGSAKKAAQDQVELLFGKDAPVKIVMKDVKTGKLIEPPANVNEKTRGQFFLQAQDVRAYESAPTAFHSLAFGADDISNLTFAPSRWKVFQKLGLGWTNPGSIFSKNVLDNMSLSSRQRTRWNALTIGLVQEVAKLDGKQSRILSKAIKDGERIKTSTGTGTVYSPKQLRAMGMDDDGVRAYYGYRNATDILYDVVNRQTRTGMQRQGLMDIQGPAGRIGFGKPLRETDALKDIRVDIGRQDLDVYDAATGTFARLSPAGIAQLYKQGDSLARLKTPIIGKADNEAAHVIVGTKKGTHALELPRQVTTKIEGYYPHMWEGNFIVYGTTKNGNRMALGLARTEAEARAVVEKKNAVLQRKTTRGGKSRFTSFNYDFDRSLADVGHRGAVQEDIYVNMGGPVYGQRNGGSLRNFSKADGDILVDPIEALVRGFEVVGQSVTKSELAQNMRQKLYNFVQAEGLQLQDMRALPDPVTNPILANAGKKAAYDKATAYLDQIEMFLRTPDQVDQAMSTMFLGASSFLSELARRGVPGAKWLSGKAADKAARGADPAAAMMGFLHRTAIAASPMKQLALQASQSLIMLGINPKQYAKAASQVSGISMLLGLRSQMIVEGPKALLGSSWKAAVESFSKLVPDMKPAEVEQVVNTIFDSGITSAVGHHSQMRSSVRSAAESRMRASAAFANKGAIPRAVSNFVRGADAQTFGRLSSVGFEAGENINQIATFLTLYNRDKAAKVANLADPDYVRSLVGKVAEVTGNMVPELGFGYQRGWFKNAFQFVAFQQKMIQLMLPEKLGGSRSLTASEKAGMVFAQFLLFGRRGTAYTDALYRTVNTKINSDDVPEEERAMLQQMWNDPSTRAVMDGLLFDYMGNQVLKKLYGPDTPDFALSDSFAPGGGSEFLIERLMALGQGNQAGLAGLSGEKTSKLVAFIQKSYNISLAQVQDLDDVPFDERAMEIAKQGGGMLISTMDRFLAAKAAQKMDGWVSGGGTVTEGFSGPLEGQLYTHFGITTKDRESLYSAMDKFMDTYKGDAAFRAKTLDDVADKYYKDLLLYTTKLDQEAPSQTVYDNMLDQWVRQRGLLHSVLDPDEAEYVSERVNARLRSAITSKDSAEAKLITRITEDVLKGRMGKEGPDALLYLEQAPFVRSNPRLKEIIHSTYVEATTEDLE